MPLTSRNLKESDHIPLEDYPSVSNDDWDYQHPSNDPNFAGPETAGTRYSGYTLAYVAPTIPPEP